MPVYIHPAASLGEPDVYGEALKEATVQLENATNAELLILLKQRKILAPSPWSRTLVVDALAHCFASNAEIQIAHDNQKCCVIS